MTASRSTARVIGAVERVAIEYTIAEPISEQIDGHVRFWLAESPVGDYQDFVAMQHWRRLLDEFLRERMDRCEPELLSADASEVFRLAWEPVMKDGAPEVFERSFPRFHIAHLGASSLSDWDLLMVECEGVAQRLLWRSGSMEDVIGDATLSPGELQGVVAETLKKLRADLGRFSVGEGGR